MLKSISWEKTLYRKHYLTALRVQEKWKRTSTNWRAQWNNNGSCRPLISICLHPRWFHMEENDQIKALSNLISTNKHTSWPWTINIRPGVNSVTFKGDLDALHCCDFFFLIRLVSRRKKNTKLLLANWHQHTKLISSIGLRHSQIKKKNWV